MNKKKNIESHKIALLVNLTLDAEVNDNITDVCAEVVDYLYGVTELKNSTYIQEMSNEFENRITKNPNEIASLLKYHLIEFRANEEKALRLIELIKNEVGNEAVNQRHIHKLNTLVRKNYDKYKNR